MACTRCARTPNSRCVASLKPAVSRIVRLASRRPARDFGIGARPTVFQVHTMVRLAADVASWQTKMSSAAAMVSLPSAAYPLALPSAMVGIASPRIPSPGIRKATRGKPVSPCDAVYRDDRITNPHWSSPRINPRVTGPTFGTRQNAH